MSSIETFFYFSANDVEERDCFFFFAKSLCIYVYMSGNILNLFYMGYVDDG